MAIIQTTINGLRTYVGTPSSDTFYVTDEGMEGMWEYAGTTATFTDNLGTTLNSGWTIPPPPALPTAPTTWPQHVFKRVYQESVNVKWFGAKGNGVADDTVAIQNALNFISLAIPSIPSSVTTDWNRWIYGGGTLFFPAGTFIIKDTLKIGEHCRLLGVSKGGDAYPYGSGYNTGSVLKCNFSDNEKWAIESSCYWTTATLTPGAGIEKDGYVTGGDFDNLRVTTSTGIVIEGLVIDCRSDDGITEQVFGGIRLNAAPDSVIRDCTVFNSRIAILMSACWNAAVCDVFTVSKWYGLILCDCNEVKVVNTYFNGQGNVILECECDGAGCTGTCNVIEDGSGGCSLDKCLKFIYPDYQGLDVESKKGSTGIYLRGTSSVSIDTSVIENFNNGLFATWSNFSTNSLYVEKIISYGFLMTGPVQASLTQTRLVNMLYGFYIGVGPHLIVDNVNLAENVDFLYKPNDIQEYRLIEFNQVRVATAPLTLTTGKREFKKDVFFTDELSDTIYVDPSIIDNRLNFGFSESDPVYSFDDALIRAIYSQRRVKRILIKSGATVTKDFNERVLDALDILISTYGESNTPATIYFDGINHLGQMSIRGNVKLVLRNINLECNDTVPSSYDMYASIFRLNQGYFELFLEKVEIDLKNGYSLIAGDYGGTNKSFVMTRWVNVSVVGTGQSRLSPYQWGYKLLAVDCFQYNSGVSTSIYAMPDHGWDDAQIINNNI